MSHYFYDAHMHLQSSKLLGVRDTFLDSMEVLGIRNIVVNGTCEKDWGLVQQLSSNERVLPAFGIHPYFGYRLEDGWDERLKTLLDSTDSTVGEIGLDRVVEHLSFSKQELLFSKQLVMAVERNMAVTIHCVKALGKLLELLKREGVPDRGFLLHAYSGPKEMIADFVKLGARFSFSGSFLNRDHISKIETFKSIPLDRLLIETDSPNLVSADRGSSYPAVFDEHSKKYSHPESIVDCYKYLSEFLEIDMAKLCSVVESNFNQLFCNTND